MLTPQIILIDIDQHIYEIIIEVSCIMQGEKNIILIPLNVDQGRYNGRL